MTFEKSNFAYFIAFILTGAILGSAAGAFAAKIFPAVQIINENLTGNIGFNLEIVAFSIKLNLSSIAGILIGIFVFRKV